MSTNHARADAVERSADDHARNSRCAAFDDIVVRYTRRVTFAAYRITRNIDDARDVAQHVFLQMHLKAPPFGDQRSIERWLYIVTRNEALNVHRRRLREAAAAAYAIDAGPQLGLEDLVVRSESNRNVRATIARLSASDREVIELRHLQSIPASEIAIRFGIPLQRVKRDVERARHRLRVEMLRNGLASDAH